MTDDTTSSEEKAEDDKERPLISIETGLLLFAGATIGELWRRGDENTKVAMLDIGYTAVAGRSPTHEVRRTLTGLTGVDVELTITPEGNSRTVYWLQQSSRGKWHRAHVTWNRGINLRRAMCGEIMDANPKHGFKAPKKKERCKECEILTGEKPDA